MKQLFSDTRQWPHKESRKMSLPTERKSKQRECPAEHRKTQNPRRLNMLGLGAEKGRYR
jgi:hypothetical protein